MECLCVFFLSSRLNDYRSIKKKWDLSRLPRFDKDFYKEHTNVTSRPDVRMLTLECQVVYGL